MMRFVVPFLVVFLSACQTAYKDGQSNENAAYFRLPVNSKLMLNQTLTISAKSSRTYFQFGRTRVFHEINQYRPYCELRMQTKGEGAQSVGPAEFIIQQVVREMRFTVDGGLIQLASDPEATEWLVLATVMHLHSESEPNVISLACASWGLPQDMSHLTIRKIRATLGDIFTLKMGAQ